MAGKKPGRPTKEEGDRGTVHVRLFADLVEKIGWIVRVEGGSSAQLLDPLIRGSILARYAQIEDVVKQMQAAEDRASKHREK